MLGTPACLSKSVQCHAAIRLEGHPDGYVSWEMWFEYQVSTV